MKYQDVLKRFVSEQAQLLQEKQMKQQMQEQRLAANAQALGSFVPGQQQFPQEEYSETEHNPFEEGQEYKAGGIHIDPSKKGTFKAQATRMGMSIQEAASHILNNRERYSPGMVKKANFAKNFAKEEGGEMYGDPPKKNPYRTQVRASNNFNLANGNTNFNSSSMFIDDYDDGTPSDTSYMHVTPTENVFFSTAINPETKQKFGQRQSNDKFSQLTPEERKYYQAKIMQELQRKESGGMFTGDYEYEEGGDKKSVVENTSGPRADESYIPMDYLSFISSDQYQPSQNEKFFNPATGQPDKVYRQEGNPMSIDYIKSKLADNTTRKDSFNNLDPVHRYYDTELVNSARDSYDTYKQSHLKDKVEGNIQNYPDMEDVVKGAHDHNLQHGYDDTDIITSHLTNQANKEGLDIYDFMAKYYGGSSPNAVARQLLVDYSKKMKK